MRKLWKDDWKFVLITGVILLVFVGAIESSVNSLKREINRVVQTECLANSSSVVYQKYDDLVQANIDQQTTAYRLNLQKGDKAKATADLAFAARFKADKIPIPNAKQLRAQCSKPLLK